MPNLLSTTVIAKIVVADKLMPLIAIIQISSDSTRVVTGPLVVFVMVLAFSDYRACP